MATRTPEQQREHFARWYAKPENRQRQIAKSVKNKALRVQKRSADLAVLKDKPCMDCGGEFHPCQMDFDHVQGEKVANIAAMKDAAPHRIDAELKKCELVCSNCHRLRTHLRRQKPQGHSAMAAHSPLKR